ncbi:MAG TPA: GGDEF domain-containing protein [Rhizobiaceae bacterium]|nr:GGDEF domain-containing protein [Rhizobiaceae bacterium]
MNVIMGKSAATVLLCMAVTTAIMLTVAPIMNEPIKPGAWIITTLASTLLGGPISFFFFRQGARYRALIGELQSSRGELQKLNALLQEKTLRDDMTGLLRREAFFDEIETRKMRHSAGALLILDADHFKSINDAYGHLTGDDALHMIVSAIRNHVRQDDIIGRIGGEEFAIFLPGAEPAEALAVAERIRVAIEVLRFEPIPGQRRPLTVSIGGTPIWPEASVSQLMRLADRRLYRAKNGGRNRVDFGFEQPLAA